MRTPISLLVAGFVAVTLGEAPARADGNGQGDRMIDQKLAKADDDKKAAGQDGARAGAKKPDAEVVPGTTAMCIDQEIADRLAIKRKRRGAVDRLFVKRGRHELSAGGGYYASDLLSSTYILGGSYTYHMTDETAVEFAGWWTHANADIIRALEDQRATVVTDTYAREIFAESLLVWSPVYGKLRLGGTIVHFDLHADVGVGVIDSNTSRGAAGVLGFGMKLFTGQAVAFRIDARNRTFRQELLDEHFLVNDSAVTASVSLFLPFHN
jgi:outer membrane beta-barrel protein